MAKHVPGSDVPPDEIFDFPFLIDDETTDFLLSHGRIMFIVRGPPGTGKNSLKGMIKNQYTDGVICTADDFFSQTFNSAARTRESLKKSHEHCSQRVEEECKKGTHPVIVSNTHMKRCELQPYINFAAQYGYTIIIASTMDKFRVNPEILAKTNTKGLTKDYFKIRLSQWQEFYPIHTGWFLSINDSCYLLKQLQSALDALLEDGKFCRVLNVYDKEKLLERYQTKDVLLSIAGYTKNSPLELGSYFQSQQVKESFGKSFEILFKAFIVTESDILAITEINDELACLMPKVKVEESAREDDGLNSLLSAFETLSVQGGYNFKSIPLKNEFPNELENGTLEESKPLNLNRCSCIHIAQKGDRPFSGWETMKMFKNCLSSLSFSDSLLLDSFTELNDDFKMMRLPEDIWMVKPSNDICFTTIFTGLYI